MIRKIVITGVLLSFTALSGCASQAVTATHLEENTAFSLGMDKSDFTISNRRDSGIKTSYLVKTNSGQQYSCYVTGTFSVVGRAVSDAICNEKGKPARNPLLR